MAERAHRRDAEEEVSAPRRRGGGIWSGTLTFGLVSIPVELRSGVRSVRVSLRMLDEDGTPVERRYVCSADGKELGPEDIVRGYEVEPDEFVVVTDEELEGLAPEKSRDIDLRTFVALAEIDPMLFDRAYFLMPGSGTTKAYSLLARTMEDAKLAGVATFVMREKEYVVAIISEGGLLRAATLRFADEIRTDEAIGLPAVHAAAQRDVHHIEKAIEKLSASAVDPATLVDEREQRLMQLIADKDAGGRDVVKVGRAAAERGEETVVDLMEKLKAALAERSEAKRAGPDRKTKKAARKRSSRHAA